MWPVAGASHTPTIHGTIIYISEGLSVLGGYGTMIYQGDMSVISGLGAIIRGLLEIE